MDKLSEFRARLEGVRVEDNPKAVQAKSRDFYWYSPVLKRKLDHVVADLVVQPRDEDEVLRVLAAAYALEIPVTPRGAGTGNYGQAMPLAGGVVLDLSGLSDIVSVKPGEVVCGAGALCEDVDRAARETGQELRMHPSTKETATIGGFVAGGSGGVGSVRWGALRDPGNILGVRVATMEETPRLIDLVGAEVHQVHHAYGVNGVIVQVTMPLAPKPEPGWVELLLAHSDWLEANRFAERVSNERGLWLKEVATVQAPAPHRYFLRHRKFLEEGESVVAAMAAPNAVAPLLELAKASGFREAYNSATVSAAEAKGLPHIHHLLWNHTTLRALRVDPEITYLQVAFPDPDRHGKIRRIAEMFPGEVIGHNEFMGMEGRIECSGLSLVRFTTEERLREIVAAHEAIGCLSFSPHHYTVEEGGMKASDPLQLDFKARHDPKGLLNPGKMIGWEAPGFDYADDYEFAGMMAPRDAAE
ncbi:MAG TPA: FAD-binding oxidoreductase [Paracoccaceae bacterium]|nr:FAD-binding oxidoreductase [Paracoccaceae bacterium]